MLCAGRAARADRGRVLEHRNTEINTAESVHLCNVWQVGRSAADKLKKWAVSKKLTRLYSEMYVANKHQTNTNYDFGF